MNKPTKVLILGLGGMVGHKLFVELSKISAFDVFATTRSVDKFNSDFTSPYRSKIIPSIDVNQLESVAKVLDDIKPNVLINCIGITKQLVSDNNPIPSISINSLFPHLLADACRNHNIRMIQMATDCVFNGAKGNYTETDPSDATDLYGRTKFLGEVCYPHCLTIRTSFIGHELSTPHGLLEWFLSQKNETKGYTHAIYSGIPTVEIARVFIEYILPNKSLTGLYQISSEPISKYHLLKIIAKQYGKNITINPESSIKIDRSLNSSKFRLATGYRPKPWQELIKDMFLDYNTSSYYHQ